MSEGFATGRRQRVLFVDDDLTLVQSFAHVLGPYHDVVTATSPVEAAAAASGGPGFDVVVCDLTMPGGSGFDVYEHLVGQDPGYAGRFLLMSGRALTEAERHRVAKLALPFLAKPLTKVALLSAIQDIEDSRFQRHASLPGAWPSILQELGLVGLLLPGLDSITALAPSGASSLLHARPLFDSSAIRATLTDWLAAPAIPILFQLPGADPSAAALLVTKPWEPQRIQAVLRHDLRTPLTTLHLLCEALMEAPDTPEPVVDDIRTMLAAVRRMAELLDTFR